MEYNIENKILKTITKHYPYSFIVVAQLYDKCKSFDKVIYIIEKAQKLGIETEELL